MIRALFATSATALVLALTATGCAANTGEDELMQDTSAVTSSTCTSAQYNQALVHYKNAVAWSKERNSMGICEWQNGYMTQIADEASRAVMTCGDFRKTIRTSPWAAPIRQALSISLNLRSFTGELAVIRDSQFQSWKGVETMFAGTSFWAFAQGVYGPPVRIDFAANGVATYGKLVHDPVTDDISFVKEAATYTVQSIDGSVGGKRVVRVTHGGEVEEYDLGVQNPYEYKDAPLFFLKSRTENSPTLYSLYSECDA